MVSRDKQINHHFHRVKLRDPPMEATVHLPRRQQQSNQRKLQQLQTSRKSFREFMS